MQNKGFTRRGLLKCLAAGSALVSLPNLAEAVAPCVEAGKQVINWSSGMKPLYCLAYIDPSNPLHQGQDNYIAQYPLAVVPQESASRFVTWKDGLKNLNPNLKLLAYMEVAEETIVPGPGHDIVRQKAQNSFLTIAGVTITVPISGVPGLTQGRLYDPRKKEWQDAFVEACGATLNSYAHYSGLFLDQCYIYGMSPPSDANEMYVALTATIQRVRAMFPNKIIIANSSRSWSGANGEMNEGRPAALPAEAAAYSGHASPRMELFHYTMTSASDTVNATQMFNLALQNKTFFGTGVSSQSIKWYPFFDDILQGYTIV